MLSKTNIIAVPVSVGLVAVTNYYNGLWGTIKLHDEAMVQRVFGDSARRESRGGTVERIARIITHELRHLTSANHSIPQSNAQSSAALFSSSAHDSSPREIDANKFERQVWDRQEGVVNDF